MGKSLLGGGDFRGADEDAAGTDEQGAGLEGKACCTSVGFSTSSARVAT